jgi:hypothetical protein
LLEHVTTKERRYVDDTTVYDAAVWTNLGLVTTEQSKVSAAMVSGQMTYTAVPTPRPLIGVHAAEPLLVAGGFTSKALNASALTVTPAAVAGRLDLAPFAPVRRLAVSEFAIEVTTLVALATAKIVIYRSDPVTGLPAGLMGASGDLVCSTLGVKNWVSSLTFEADALYWLGVHSSLAQAYRGIALAAAQGLTAPASGTAITTLLRATATYASGAPATAPAMTATSAVVPWIRMAVA